MLTWCAMGSWFHGEWGALVKDLWPKDSSFHIPTWSRFREEELIERCVVSLRLIILLRYCGITLHQAEFSLTLLILLFFFCHLNSLEIKVDILRFKCSIELYDNYETNLYSLFCFKIFMLIFEVLKFLYGRWTHLEQNIYNEIYICWGYFWLQLVV